MKWAFIKRDSEVPIPTNEEIIKFMEKLDMKNQYKEDLKKAITLLEEAVYFINYIPRSDKVRGFKDSYELATAIEKYLNQITE